MIRCQTGSDCHSRPGRAKEKSSGKAIFSWQQASFPIVARHLQLAVQPV